MGRAPCWLLKKVRVYFLALFRYGGFAKNQQANIKDNELKALRLLAKQLLGYNKKALSKAVKTGELIEVCNNGKN